MPTRLSRQTIRFCTLIVFAAASSALAAPAFEVVAGTGISENNGDSGSAANINIGQPFGVEIGPDGALYITEVENHRVRRLDLKTREITTVAGCGRRGYSGDGGPAVDAEMNEPYEVRFDRDGNMYVVEMRNHVVRRIDKKTNTISTIAGIGRQGFSGDGGSAIKAMLSQPHSIALDAQGAVYIADIGNHRIRRVDPKTGVIDSIAGSTERAPPRDGQLAHGNPILGPRALFIDGNTMWIALREGHSIWRMALYDGVLHHIAGTGKAGYTGDDGPASKAQFNGPKGIAVFPKRFAFVVDAGNNAIRKIDLQSAEVTTLTGADLKQPHGICVSADGEVFIGDTMNHRVLRTR
jgi:DNA-binding beta-propeller fold protein YncE